MEIEFKTNANENADIESRLKSYCIEKFFQCEVEDP